MASAFVPLLNNIKDKNVAFILSKFNKINSSGPNTEDYENVERKKTRSELMLLSLVVFGIEICYAAETAYVSPILQKIGVPIQFMSMVWGLSPLVGLFAGPLLGSLSDECRSSLGRRRPFIIMHSIGIILGLILTGYGHLIGNFFNPTQEHGVNALVILVTILGVILLDFDCDACQSPARAYLIDVSRVEDHSLGLSMFTVMAGAGGCIGYTLGGIPWARLLFTDSHSIGPLIPIAPTKSSRRSTTKSSFNTTTTSWLTSSPDDYYNMTTAATTIVSTTTAADPANDGGDLAYGHKQILFTMVAIIYVFCAVISITSFKEIPLDMLDKPMNVRLKTVGQQSDGATDGSNMKYKRMEEDDVFEWEKRITGDDIDAISIDRVEFRDLEKEKLGVMDSINGTIRAIIEMPVSLRWLCITHCLCWMSLLCFSLYFTDFVGEEVFGGIPAGEASNISLNRLYDSGVRFGSICMALYSFSCSVYSFFLKHLMGHFKTANVYRFSQIVYAIGMLVLAVTKSQMIVPLTSITAGIIYSSLFTIPFILVASYHNQESFGLIDSHEQERGKRGLGMDLSIVSSMVFVAQIILSFIIGPLMKVIHSKTVVIFTASFLSFMAFLSSNKLLYLD